MLSWVLTFPDPMRWLGNVDVFGFIRDNKAWVAATRNLGTFLIM